jgi:quinohemoprotein ethanol dehydrogenase
MRKLGYGVVAAVFGVVIGTSSYAADKPGDDWQEYGGPAGERHFSPLTQINDKTISKLGLAWSIDLPLANSVSEPISVGGTLYYVTGYGVVHAVVAETGKAIWDYDPKTYEVAGRKLGVGWGSRGIASWNGKIYVGTQDGRLIAIDAKTGKPVWSQMTISPDDMNYITGAPRVFEGKVIIGFGGADVGPARGYVTTYDAETGKLLWRFYTVPGNPAVDTDETTKLAASSWAGEWWKDGGGGTVWNAMTYDPETDTVFLGTGNGSPWNHKVRSQGKGDNLYLCSIVALDAKTGKYKWHYQFNPGETWDYNSVMDMPLATVMVDGKPRKVVMQAPKNGFLYVIDRLTGKLIAAEKIAKVSWATKIDLETGRPVETPEARYPNGTMFMQWPGGSGAHSWHPMALNPKTNMLYIPVLERSNAIGDMGVKNDEWRKLQPISSGQTATTFGAGEVSNPLNDTSRLDAWDVTAMKRVWSQPTPGRENGGVLATGGNLVFQGNLGDRFSAYAADTGKLLWSYDSKAPIIAPPISYEVNGKQYVTIQTGFSTAGSLAGEALAKFRIDYRTQARRVLTFAIGGTGTLPPKQADTLQPAEDADYKVNESLANHGAVIFGRHCMQCHGVMAVAAGAAPDLRTSTIPQSAETFKDIVMNGALLPNGMPKFTIVKDADAEALRQYIRSRAQDWRKSLSTEKPTN